MTASSSLSRLKFALFLALFGLIITAIGFGIAHAFVEVFGLTLSTTSLVFAALAYNKLTKSIEAISAVCGAAAAGNLEQRLIKTNEGGQILAIADQVNHLLDISDAFVRETSASFGAVQRGNFSRRIIERGLSGAYGDAAATVNTAIAAMDKKFTDFGQLIAMTEATTQRVLSHVINAATKLGRDSDEMIDATNSAESGVSLIGQSATATTNDAKFVANAANELTNSSGHIDQQLGQSREVNERASNKIMQTRKVMNALTTATQEIGPIAEIIRKVAAQTRLLAMNASIEAVHAGAHGVAFAVVANEVKSLSDKTAEASDDIFQRIAQIENNAQAAVQTIEGFVATVEELTQISQEIEKAVAEQLLATNNISKATIETANRSDEMVQSVTDVLGAINQTSSQAQNVDSAAKLLGSEANILNEELGQFLQSAKAIVGAGR